MLTESISLPFTFTQVYQGFGEDGGVLRATPEGLTLEFEVKEALLGLLKSGVKEISIPMREIASVTLKKGWFRTRLIIRATHLKTLREVEGNQGAEITLRVSRKDRALADELVAMLNLRLCAQDLKKMEESLRPENDRGTETA